MWRQDLQGIRGGDGGPEALLEQRAQYCGMKIQAGAKLSFCASGPRL